MNRNRIFLPSFLGLVLAAAIPAAAQPTASAAIRAGAAVRDTAGGEVGTVTSVDGQYLLLKTDKHEVRLPVSSFTPADGALLFGMTRDQLNAEIEKSLAAANASIVAGANVTGSAGSAVGTIEAVDAQFVTLKLSSGAAVRLPRSAVAGGPNGVVIGMTAEQLEAAAKEAAAAQPQQ